jgi:hypothetical protein
MKLTTVLGARIGDQAQDQDRLFNMSQAQDKGKQCSHCLLSWLVFRYSELLPCVFSIIHDHPCPSHRPFLHRRSAFFCCKVQVLAYFRPVSGTKDERQQT